MVLTNHTTNSDSFYAGFCLARHMYFVSGENVLRVPVAGKVIKAVADPVFRKKGASGQDAREAIVKRIREGNRLCMTVEGNKSFNGQSSQISPNTAQLIRDAGVPVITLAIHGGYMVQPRWSDTVRKGRIWSEVVHEYSLEEIASLSNEELNERILKDISVDAYEDQKYHMYKYRGRNLAQGIERILYMCPKCKSISTIHSHGNSATCDCCGLEIEMDKYGFFHSNETDFTTVAEWEHWERNELVKKLAQNKNKDEKVFETKADFTLYKLNDDATETDCGTTSFDVYCDRLVLGEHTFYMKDIEHFSLSMSSRVLFTTSNGDYWKVKAQSLESVVKFLIAVQFFQGKPIHLR